MLCKILNLGCPKNLVDGEILAGVLACRTSGMNISQGSYIVNTCSFIASAQEEALLEIRKAVSMKRSGKISEVYVTGCMVISHLEEIKAIDGIDRIIEPIFCQKGLFDRNELFQNRILASGPGTAYVRIADGCNRRCAYCLIPSIRGPYRSRKLKDIISEVEILADKGINEIILISEDVGLYGSDIYGKPILTYLLITLDRINGIKWIRLLYLNPESLTNELLETVKTSRKVLHYFDIPLQHTNNRILIAMNRKPLPLKYSEWLRNIYDILPNAVIRITLMVGFPSETEEDFQLLLGDIISNPPDHLTAFKYSREKKTKSFKMRHQISEEVKDRRYNELMGLYYKLGVEKRRKRFVGRKMEFIIENKNVNLQYSLGNGSVGRLWFQAPDIDGKIFIPDYNMSKEGEITTASVDGIRGYDFIGSVII
ncbi:MAG: MiaB/RimO family radical SAM methylthiotransferase [bacterium]